MASAMAGEEGHRDAFGGKGDCDGRGGVTPRGFGVELGDRLEGAQCVESGAADNSQHDGFYTKMLSPIREFITLERSGQVVLALCFARVHRRGN